MTDYGRAVGLDGGATIPEVEDSKRDQAPEPKPCACCGAYPGEPHKDDCVEVERE
jgi:hypothetical protein